MYRCALLRLENSTGVQLTFRCALPDPAVSLPHSVSATVAVLEKWDQEFPGKTEDFLEIRWRERAPARHAAFQALEQLAHRQRRVVACFLHLDYAPFALQVTQQALRLRAESSLQLCDR